MDVGFHEKRLGARGGGQGRAVAIEKHLRIETPGQPGEPRVHVHGRAAGQAAGEHERGPGLERLFGLLENLRPLLLVQLRAGLVQAHLASGGGGDDDVHAGVLAQRDDAGGDFPGAQLCFHFAPVFAAEREEQFHLRAERLKPAGHVDALAASPAARGVDDVLLLP